MTMPDKAAEQLITDCVGGIQSLSQAQHGADRDKLRAHAMALCVGIVCRVFLENGGMIDRRELFADTVRAGVLQTIQAYKDLAKQTHKSSGEVQ